MSERGKAGEGVKQSVFIGVDTQDNPLYLTDIEAKKVLSRQMKIKGTKQEGVGLPFSELCQHFEKFRVLNKPKPLSGHASHIDGDILNQYRKEGKALTRLFLEGMKHV